MLLSIVGVLSQALITLILLVFINRKGIHFLYYLNLYIIIVVLDFTYEYYLLNQFKNNEILYKVPSSFRLLKGIIFLYTTCTILDLKWKKEIKYLLILFIPVFVLNIVSILGIHFPWKYSQSVITVYSTIFQYYIYYWIGMLSISIILLFKYQPKRQEYLIFYKPYLYLLVFITSIVIINYTLYLLNVRSEVSQLIYTYIFLIHFGWILYLNFINLKKSSEQKENATLQQEAPKKEKYDHIHIEESEFEECAFKIETFYRESSDYFEENFSLDRLSIALKINKNRITMTFNSYLKTNFYEYTNKKRIEHFKKTFEQDPGLNILDTAYQCGFKSKSTFYKYFKQEFGLSPTEFKMSLER